MVHPSPLDVAMSSTEDLAFPGDNRGDAGVWDFHRRWSLRGAWADWGHSGGTTATGEVGGIKGGSVEGSLMQKAELKETIRFDGSEIRLAPVHMVNICRYPVIYRVLYIQSGAGFLPSTVSPAFMVVFDMMDSCIWALRISHAGEPTRLTLLM